MSKKIIIIAGPNGAGKTTFARSFLPKEAQCPRFINADLIAAGLSPFVPEAAAIRAGRLMLQEIEQVYKSALDTWAVFDNAGAAPIVTEWSEGQ